MRGLTLAVGLAVLAACAGPSAPRLSPVHERAMRHMESAEASLQQGQLERSVEQWHSAMLLWDGVVDKPRRTQAALGLSRAYTAQGKMNEAMQVLDEAAFASPAMELDQAVQLQGRRALLLMNLKQDAAAADALVKALDLCKRQCAEALALQTLQARALLSQGQNEEALAQASLGLGLKPMTPPELALQQRGVAVEQANLLRLTALSRLRLGQMPQAEQDAQRALALDRTLGELSRVVMDLDLLADIARAMGQPDRAKQLQDDSDRARKALQASNTRVKP